MVKFEGVVGNYTHIKWCRISAINISTTKYKYSSTSTSCVCDDHMVGRTRNLGSPTQYMLQYNKYIYKTNAINLTNQNGPWCYK